jgi:pSer/pThr/pTyr-binding forkhead associated (FHA) protein
MNLMIEHNGRLDYHTTEDASVLIGRSRVCDVVIGNLFVSRSHLRITSLYNGEYQVEDQQSANGSFVLSTHRHPPRQREHHRHHPAGT